jgi:hypothetical protein
MTMKQLSVFLENKSGRLAEVLRILGEAGINIYALTIADTSEYGILRLIVNDSQKAVENLKQQEFTANLTDVIAVSIDNHAGAYANIIQILANNEISIDYTYAIGLGQKAALILRPENIDATIRTLESEKVEFLKISDLNKY